MESSENVPSSSYLTRDQEHEIMVFALRQVIRGSDTSASSDLIAGESLPKPDAGPCPLCGVTGCYGCAFPRRHKEDVKKEEMKYKGVRKKPSGNYSAEIWDPSLGKKKWLGTFTTAEMTARAYDEAAAELVGRMSMSGEKMNGEGLKRRRR